MSRLLIKCKQNVLPGCLQSKERRQILNEDILKKEIKTEESCLQGDSERTKGRKKYTGNGLKNKKRRGRMKQRSNWEAAGKITAV